MDIPDYAQQCPSDQQKVDVKKLNVRDQMGNDLGGWDSMYIKQEIKKAVRQIGFEYPSEVQRVAIPIISQGKDLLCQAKSGMGKTAVFIIGVLNQIAVKQNNYIPFNCLVLCHTRELSHQVFKDFRRFSRYFKSPELRISCFFGGLDISMNIDQLRNKLAPHIVIGTPGRLTELIKQGHLPLNNIQYFIIDQCDKVLLSETMKRDVIKIYENMTHYKQVLMFSATLPTDFSKEVKQFMNNQQHIFVDPGKLFLDGLSQFNLMVFEKDKFTHLVNLLDRIKFNQGLIFVNKIQRAKKLTDLLTQKLFNPICLHSNMSQPERIINYDMFRENKSKLLIATDLFGRGIDIERVNLVINYDIPFDRDTYLHRVGRAGRFNTKGLAINFVCHIGDCDQTNEWTKDVQVMKQIQDGLHSTIPFLPENFRSQQYI